LENLNRFRQTILEADLTNFESAVESFEIRRQGRLTMNYAPFEHFNSQARLVICGITPGLQQMRLSIQELKDRLEEGDCDSDALSAAKKHASFGGPMRANLIRMLNYIGLDKKLGVEDCATLFEENVELVHFTSALRYPVFLDGNNYSGAPSMTKNSFLMSVVNDYFAKEIAMFGDGTIFLPLGPKVEEVMQHFIDQGKLKKVQVLAGMPHPSGANNERIKYFIGEKQNPSPKTNRVKLDIARKNIFAKLAAI